MRNKPFWRRRREALALRQPRPVVEDPENDWRKRDCAVQMKIFDSLPPQVRTRLHEGRDNPDLADLVRRVQREGASNRVRRLLKERELLPCDVPFEDLLALELAG